MIKSVKMAIGIAVVVFIGGAAIFLYNKPRDSKFPASVVTEDVPIQGEKIPVLGKEHVSEGIKITDYNSNPPTSGKHWPRPADWGAYDKPLPDEILVHNLEHGGIWISYKGVDKKTEGLIKSMANKYNQAVITAPRPSNDSTIAIASWGRLLKLDKFDEGRIEKFIMANVNNSPEPLASLEQTKAARDKQAPEARFTALDGKEIYLSGLKGEKIMFWLFATWCPSCIAGAQAMEKRSGELLNLKIVALKTYGNSGYNGPAVREFAGQNAPSTMSASNWIWGEASADASNAYNPRNFPDIYFLIDEAGIVRAVDTAPAATINKIINFANE